MNWVVSGEQKKEKSWEWQKPAKVSHKSESKDAILIRQRSLDNVEVISLLYVLNCQWVDLRFLPNEIKISKTKARYVLVAYVIPKKI